MTDATCVLSRLHDYKRLEQALCMASVTNFVLNGADNQELYNKYQQNLASNNDFDEKLFDKISSF